MRPDVIIGSVEKLLNNPGDIDTVGRIASMVGAEMAECHMKAVNALRTYLGKDSPLWQDDDMTQETFTLIEIPLSCIYAGIEQTHKRIMSILEHPTGKIEKVPQPDIKVLIQGMFPSLEKPVMDTNSFRAASKKVATAIADAAFDGDQETLADVCEAIGRTKRGRKIHPSGHHVFSALSESASTASIALKGLNQSLYPQDLIRQPEIMLMLRALHAASKNNRVLPLHLSALKPELDLYEPSLILRELLLRGWCKAIHDSTHMPAHCLPYELTRSGIEAYQLAMMHEADTHEELDA